MVGKGITIAYVHEPSTSCYRLLLKNGFQELNDGKQREVFRRLNNSPYYSERTAA